MHLIVGMKTSSGTYIKEFFHSDEGRTPPCLFDLLGAKRADFIALNVTQIHMEWPYIKVGDIHSEPVTV